MLERIYARVTKWLARKGFLREPDASNAPPEMTPTEAVTIEAMARGTLDTVRDGGDALASEKAASEPPPTCRCGDLRALQSPRRGRPRRAR